MDLNNRKKIYKCFNTLVDHITGYDVTDHLISQEILTFDDGQMIKAQLTDNNKARTLLEYLLYKKTFPQGVDPYTHFIHALEISGRKDLVLILKETDVSEIKDSDLETPKTDSEKIDYLMSEVENLSKFIQNYGIRVRTNKEHNRQDVLTINYEGNESQTIENKATIEFILRLSNAKIIPKDQTPTSSLSSSLKSQGEAADLQPSLLITNVKTVILGSPLSSDGDYTDKGVSFPFSRSLITYKSNIEKIACHIALYLLQNKNLNQEHSNPLYNKIRILVLQIIERNEHELTECIHKLHITELEAGYPAVSKIADELFIDINWGRIITWYAFWRHLMLTFPGGDGNVDKNCLDVRDIFGNFIGFILSEKCGNWIIHHGGWDSLPQHFETRRKCSIV